MSHHDTTGGRLAVLGVAALLLAGCGQSTGQGTDAAASAAAAASPTGAPRVQLPDGFPARFPPPPAEAVLLSTEVVEDALLGGDLQVEHGTVVRTSVRYEYDSGDPTHVQRVLDYYREALPPAGWRIVADQPPPSPSEDPRRPRSGHLLQADGHGRQVNLTVEHDEEKATVSVRASLHEVTEGRKPSEHRPMLTLPDWYRQLPEPPVGKRRYQIRITAVLGEPISYYFDYEADPDQPHANGEDPADELARHYRRSLPAGGWTIREVRDRTERPDQQGPVAERYHVTVEFTGYGMVGTAHASQAVSTTGQLLENGVSLTLHPGTWPVPEPSLEATP